MHDAAMRRIAALVLAALLAISGAALTTAYFAADAQAKNFVGTDRGEKIVGTDQGSER